MILSVILLLNKCVQPSNILCFFQLSVRPLHLASAKEIVAFTEKIKAEFSELNIVVVNADHLSGKPDTTVEGFERNFGLNFVASFLLSEHLLPWLHSSATRKYPSRLVFVSSRAHHYGGLPVNKLPMNPKTNDFSWWRSFSTSQVSLMNYANSLVGRVDSVKVIVTTVHPGVQNELFKLVFPEVCGFIFNPF